MPLFARSTSKTPLSTLTKARAATNDSLNALGLGVGAIALIVGGLGIANTMVVSVLERRNEIGLRRALGARTAQITLQFLTEAVALSTLGALAGVVLGLAATLVLATVTNAPFIIPPAH